VRLACASALADRSRSLVLGQHGEPPTKIHAIFTKLDTNHDHMISRDEWRQGWTEALSTHAAVTAVLPLASSPPGMDVLNATSPLSTTVAHSPRTSGRLVPMASPGVDTRLEQTPHQKRMPSKIAPIHDRTTRGQ
jgi:hypothetical protein